MRLCVMLMFMSCQTVMMFGVVVVNVRVNVQRRDVAPSRDKGQSKHGRHHTMGHKPECME